MKYFFLLTIRSWIRDPKITFINLMGLSLGIAAAILLYLYIMHEYSFESMHSKSDNIFRLYTTVDGRDGGQAPFSSPAIGPALKDEIPEVISFVRIAQQNTSILHEDKKVLDLDMLMVDSTFFDIFDFEVLEGNPCFALTQPTSLILTKSLVDRLFLDQNALNRTVDVIISKIDLSTGQMNQILSPFLVGAVIKDPPTNTHLQFDLLAPVYAIDKGYFTLESHIFATYLLFDRPVNDGLYTKTTHRARDLVVDAIKLHTIWSRINLEMQSLKDIRFGPTMYVDFSPQGSKQTIRVFTILAVFILIIAIANFINLSTARSEKRLVEAGIKKVLGSNRFHLILHYVGESVLLTGVGVLLALFAIEIALPVFSGLMGQELALGALLTRDFILSLFLFTVAVGLVAGIYPAYHFSRYEPSTVLKGKFFYRGSKPLLRIMLVTFQFAISVFLLIAVWIVNDQIRYMNKDDKGINTENILVFRNITPRLKTAWPYLKEELLRLPQVSNVIANNGMPGHVSFALALSANDHSPDDDISAVCFETNGDFLGLFGVQLLSGRWLDDRIQTSDYEFVINETAAKRLGFENTVGQEVMLQNFRGRIIGIVQDFHFQSKHEPIRPLVFTRFMNDFQRIAIKVEGGDLKEIHKRIVSVFKNADDNFVDEGVWMDQLLGEFYTLEDKTFTIIRWASIMAVAIGFIGLIGLTNYLVLARKKEICIRKVLGASYLKIMDVLLIDMLKWVLLANLIAWPLAWYAASLWLDNFAYVITISPRYFILVGLASILTTAMVIITQSYREILRNPVEGLKPE